MQCVAPAGEGVDARARRRRDRFVVGLAQLLYELRPDELVPPITTIFICPLSLGLIRVANWRGSGFVLDENRLGMSDSNPPTGQSGSPVAPCRQRSDGRRRRTKGRRWLDRADHSVREALTAYMRLLTSALYLIPSSEALRAASRWDAPSTIPNMSSPMPTKNRISPAMAIHGVHALSPARSSGRRCLISCTGARIGRDGR